MRGLQVKIHLDDGTAEGFQSIQIPGWDFSSSICSRGRYLVDQTSDDFRRPGIYILQGETTPPSAQPRIYVGEADFLRDRIPTQLKKYEFAQRVLTFSNPVSPLTQTHVKYLESKLIRLGRDAKRCQLENKVIPRLPQVSRPDRDDAETFFDRILMVLPVVGIRAFELTSQTSPPANTETERRWPALYYAERGSRAEGRITDDGFLMLKGAKGRAAYLPAAPEWIRKMRDRLLQDGVLERRSSDLILCQDYVFGSPSTAAAILVGGTVPGPLRWKSKEGRSLKQLELDASGTQSWVAPRA
jgi:hypothetical protein